MKPYYEEGGITIYHADCREVLGGLGASLLLTDPPFNIGKDYGTASDSLPIAEYQEVMTTVMGLGPERQAWVTPNKHWVFFATALGPEAHPVIIRRGAGGPIRWGWSDQFEVLMVRAKPLRPFANLWDDIRLKGEGYFFREESYGHPGYTPQPIFARLVDLLALPDDVIVDPFAGTGTSLVAAKAANRRAIGVEIEERYCEIAVKRLAQEVLAL